MKNDVGKYVGKYAYAEMLPSSDQMKESQESLEDCSYQSQLRFDTPPACYPKNGSCFWKWILYKKHKI